ncbi:MAG TPA: molybdopterin cofactor-binding domain-containing protein, partial [Candidatus Marinimicrobia bacterium]|nr:molybdopterin cofactor-binding domain-containing protein [Candidatus Neomarinimicrobiota bacterium]
MGKHIGKSVKRVEDPRFLQGQGKYVANIKLPDMAHVAVLRSPHAHAKINSINTAAAKALDGVIDVFVGQDLIDGGVGKMPVIWQVPDNKIPDRWPLTPDKVRHVGDSVAAVVAEDPYIARDALDLIEVDYEALEATTGAKATTEDGKPLVHDEIENNISFKWGLGDREACDKAFEEADHVVKLDLINQRLIANAMEPRACAAQWIAATENMTVWTTSQNPHIIRFGLSAVTLPMLDEHKLRVISPDVGGGFGSKIFHYPEEVIVPWIAKKINRPCKWVATRSESFMTDSQGRDHVQNCKLALKSDGTITGLYVELHADMGA